MFPCTSLREESIERVVSSTNGLIRWHLTVWLNAMFQTIQLPTSIPDLDTSLTNMDGDTFTLKLRKNVLNVNQLCKADTVLIKNDFA